MLRELAEQVAEIANGVDECELIPGDNGQGWYVVVWTHGRWGDPDASYLTIADARIVARVRDLED
jgi:hypothetical protein